MLAFASGSSSLTCQRLRDSASRRIGQVKSTAKVDCSALTFTRQQMKDHSSQQSIGENSKGMYCVTMSKPRYSYTPSPECMVTAFSTTDTHGRKNAGSGHAPCGPATCQGTVPGGPCSSPCGSRPQLGNSGRAFRGRAWPPSRPPRIHG